MGKGDHRRPHSVSKEEFDANFERVFGVKKLNIMSPEDREALQGGDPTSHLSEVEHEDSQ